MRRFLRDNSLSIVAFGLFGLFLVGQAVAGHEVYQRELEAHGQPAIDFATYLLSGHFIEATFENWESEFLQMGALVLLSVYLYQKGSPESKDPDADEEVDRQRRPIAPRGAMAGAVGSDRPGRCTSTPSGSRCSGSSRCHWCSTSSAAWPSTTASRRRTARRASRRSASWSRRSSGSSRCRTGRASSCPWARSWCSTIFLRQRGSPESKPVDEPDSTTGEV